MLVAGGFTAIPRWSLDPSAGIAEHEAKIPDDLVGGGAPAGGRAGGRRSARCCWLRTPRCSAALSGEREVATGYVGRQGGQPLPCRLTTEPDSWRDVAVGHPSSRGELLAHS